MQEKQSESCRWLRPADVAGKFWISAKTVQRWCRSGILPCVKAGPRLWLIDGDRLDEMLQENQDFAGSGDLS